MENKEGVDGSNNCCMIEYSITTNQLKYEGNWNRMSNRIIVKKALLPWETNNNEERFR